MRPAEEEELRRTYRSQTDAALLDLAMSYDSLTEHAQTALREEFARRVLEPPLMPDAPEEFDTQPLVTVRQYRDLSDAQIAKGVLESAGIHCFLRDENMVRMEWIWSNLMGGVRLQVRLEDRTAAEELLAQSIPVQIPIDGEAPFEQPHCPRCGSLDIHFQRIHERFGMASILALGVPLPIRKQAWVCRSCDAQWRELRDTETDPAEKLE